MKQNKGLCEKREKLQARLGGKPKKRKHQSLTASDTSDCVELLRASVYYLVFNVSSKLRSQTHIVGLGKCSVRKLLAVQARGLEFSYPTSSKKKSHFAG